MVCVLFYNWASCRSDDMLVGILLDREGSSRVAAETTLELWQEPAGDSAG